MADTNSTPNAIWYVLPRGMRFERDRPTSIDLFVSEMLAHTRHSSSVVAEPPETALTGHDLMPLPATRFANTWRRARRVAMLAKTGHPGAIIVQQHLPSAAAIAARVPQPVIFQKHNFIRPPRPGLVGGPGRARHVAQFRRLAGITFVSEAVQANFEQHWPEVEIARCIVPNGFDPRLWQPARMRRPLILAVGRATPEKGLLETTEALVRLLPERPDWSGAIVMSECDRNPDYAGAVEAVASSIPGQIQILRSLPPDTVRQLYENAAIAVVPSKWKEPFGRTCLEAHAGGAAVISSGSGGLREISGPHALFVDRIEAEPLCEAMRRLVDDEDLRRHLADEGHRRVRSRFDLQAIAGVLDDFIEAVLSRSG